MASAAGSDRGIPLVSPTEDTPFAKSEAKKFAAIGDDSQAIKQEGGATDGQTRGDEGLVYTEDRSGMNVSQTAIFIASQVSGLAILLVPPLLVESGWPGLFVYPIVSLICIYTGVLLGRSWNILCKRKPEVCRDCRLPYSTLAGETYGKVGRLVVSITIGLISVSATITYLLGVSELMVSVIYPYQTFGFCYWPLIVFIFVCPLFWFAGPKELWQIAAVGTFATLLGAYIMDIKAFAVFGGVNGHPPHIIPYSTSGDGGWSGFCGLLGTSFFLVSIHYQLPTIQRDMAEPQRFSYTILGGMGLQALAMFITLVPIWLVYSSKIAKLGYVESVLNAMEAGPLRTVVSVLLLFHFVAVLVMSNNPLFQELEDHLNIPHAFNWKRVALRTLIFASELFLAETFPHFAIVTSLAGGILLSSLSLVAPVFIHLKIRQMETADDPDEVGISMPDKLVCILTVPAFIFMVVGVIYYAKYNIDSGVAVLSVPCYVNATAAHE